MMTVTFYGLAKEMGGNKILFEDGGGYPFLRFQQEGLLKMEGEVYSPDSLTFCESLTLAYSLIREKLPNAKDIRIPYEELVGSGRAGYHPWVSQKRLFPFDVINLDFNKPPFLLRDSDYSPYIEAVSKTFLLQKAHQCSFSLFVTCPAEDEQDNEVGRAKIIEVVNSNLAQTSSSFAQRYRELYDVELVRPYYQLYLIIIPKLVLRAGTQEDFEVSCTARFTYVGRPKATTRMVSFIFDCEHCGATVYEEAPLFGALQQHYDEELVKLLERTFVDVNEELDRN